MERDERINFQGNAKGEKNTTRKTRHGNTVIHFGKGVITPVKGEVGRRGRRV